LIIAIGIIAVQAGAYYYLQTLYSPAGSAEIGVNALVNYGNSTLHWYNETSFSAGSNFYNLTVYLTRGNVEAQFYPSFNEHFVTGINGVKNQGETYWTLWMLCQKQNAWAVSPIGADLIQLANGQTLAWAYEVPYRAPVTGARMVGSCS